MSSDRKEDPCNFRNKYAIEDKRGVPATAVQDPGHPQPHSAPPERDQGLDQDSQEGSDVTVEKPDFQPMKASQLASGKSGGSEDEASLDSGVETDESSSEHAVIEAAGEESEAVLVSSVRPPGNSSSSDMLVSSGGPHPETRSPLVGRPPAPAHKIPSGCLVTRKVCQPHLPKKKVSILLPEEGSRANSSSSSVTAVTAVSPPPPPVDLRMVRVQVLDARDSRRSLTAAAATTIREQSESILVAAHRELISRAAPEICDTVELVFRPATAAYLTALAREDMGRLLLHMDQLLFRCLPVDVPYFETSLFMVHSFLLALSRAVQDLAGVEQFPDFFRELVDKCQRLSYADHSVCLKETQFLFVRFEKALIGELTANPSPASLSSSSSPATVSQSSSFSSA